jgi:hypothetical protein
MSDFLNHLEVITLLLVIIWLVASIRQSLLNTPSPLTQVKRAIRRVGEIGNIHTSRENRPINTNLTPLDQVHPDDALSAVEKYFEDNKQ